MLPIEAWLKLTKKVKKEEVYPLMTYAVLGRPSLMFQVKFTKDEEFIVMGNPSMGGLKLSSNFTFGKREFMAIYPLYYSQMLFDARYADIMQYAPYIFPLIKQFVETNEDNLEEEMVIPEPEPKEEETNNDADAHLRAGNRNAKKK